jgi:UDP-N-acetylglucosamine 4,6-dehydratase (inverting)
MFANASILITGGTGSFGKAFVGTVLKRYPEIKRLVIFSRDELKQFEMAQIWSTSSHKGLRYFLGDVRDSARVARALEGIDYVVHAAALKQVVAAEYNPFEFIQTNVLGAHNIINGCLDKGIKRVVALSTDKAAAPINLYGATKLCSDKLFVSANNIRGSRDLRFSVVRYGNVLGSRGSVIPFFLDKKASGTLPITSTEMTRFNISLQEGVDMVLWALENARGGEIFVPKIPSYRITDVAEAIGPECRKEIVGIRPGEKVHEEMITVSDGYNTVDLERYFAILPATGEQGSSAAAVDDYCSKWGARRVAPGFSYNSGGNSDFLTVEQIRDLIRAHVRPDFRH